MLFQSTSVSPNSTCNCRSPSKRGKDGVAMGFDAAFTYASDIFERTTVAEFGERFVLASSGRPCRIQQCQLGIRKFWARPSVGWWWVVGMVWGLWWGV